MFGLSMMASPFVKDMKKKALKESKFAQPDHIQVNGYPEQYLAPADARKLVGVEVRDQLPVAGHVLPQRILRFDVHSTQPQTCHGVRTYHTRNDSPHGLIT